jgi:hypothetical protein
MEDRAFHRKNMHSTAVKEIGGAARYKLTIHPIFKWLCIETVCIAPSLRKAQDGIFIKVNGCYA